MYRIFTGLLLVSLKALSDAAPGSNVFPVRRIPVDAFLGNEPEGTVIFYRHPSVSQDTDLREGANLID